MDYLGLENMGIFTAYDKQNKSEEKYTELYDFGCSLNSDAAEKGISTEEFIEIMNSGKEVEAGSAVHQCMHRLAQEALKITGEINWYYHNVSELKWK